MLSKDLHDPLPRIIAGDGFHPVTFRIGFQWEGKWDKFKTWGE